MRFIKNIDIQSIKSVSLLVLMWASGLCTILGCSKLPVQYGSPKTSVLSDSERVERLKHTFLSPIMDISKRYKHEKHLFLHGLCKNIGAYREGLKLLYEEKEWFDLCVQSTLWLSKFIYNHRRSLSILDESGYTPVHWGVETFNVKEPCEAKLFKLLITAYSLLLAEGVGVNVKSSKGDTPLHLASFRPHILELVKMLLDGGADVNAPDQNGATVLDLVKMCNPENCNREEVVQLLLAYGATSNNQDGQLKVQIWL